VIGGSLKRQRLVGPPDKATTRPMTDRVKTALFDRLSAMRVLDGVHALDVFAGTGTLGIEAVSRGHDTCTFVENHRHVVRLLERNLRQLGLSDRCPILTVDALTGGWLHALPHTPVDLVLLDPPYAVAEDPPRMDLVAALMRQLADRAEPLAAMMLRTPAAIEPPEVHPWIHLESPWYGGMALHLYQVPDHATRTP
jgi:16S rRNA (guanine(966)-N(2))-methyltransferase RsmD